MAWVKTLGRYLIVGKRLIASFMILKELIDEIALISGAVAQACCNRMVFGSEWTQFEPKFLGPRFLTRRARVKYRENSILDRVLKTHASFQVISTCRHFLSSMRRRITDWRRQSCPRSRRTQHLGISLRSCPTSVVSRLKLLALALCRPRHCVSDRDPGLNIARGLRSHQRKRSASRVYAAED